MCKLAIFPNIKDSKQNEAFELANALVPYMTHTDNDGFGMLALSDKGLYGGRWLDVNEALDFQSIQHAPPKALDDYQAMLDGINVATTSNSFGDPGTRTLSMALHSRMATCDVNLANTHPHVNADASIGLVHNGVITNARRIGLEYSTCDSEAILTLYGMLGLDTSLQYVKDLATELEGWYAAAVYTRQPDGTYLLDVFRDNRATLFAAYISEIDGIVFVTKSEHIIDACKDLGWHTPTIAKVKDCTFSRINPYTGAIQTTIALPAPIAPMYGLTKAPMPRYREDYSSELASDDGWSRWEYPGADYYETQQALKEESSLVPVDKFMIDNRKRSG